jgi:hypothetical protein
MKMSLQNNVTQIVRPSPGHETPNEVAIMRSLYRSKAIIQVETTVSDEKFYGKIAWYDLYNIAIFIDELSHPHVKVFQKSNIASWSYDARAIAA